MLTAGDNSRLWGAEDTEMSAEANNGDFVRVVVFQECGQWVAQCLEYDIGAQAGDLDELRIHLEMTLHAEYVLRKGTDADPFPGIEPAPRHFHNLWDKCGNELTPPARMGGVQAEKPIRMALCA
jgi:hypothetical protein